MHPLFEGIRRLQVVGLDKPKIEQSGDQSIIEANGPRGALKAVTIETQGQTLTVRLTPVTDKAR